MQQDTIQSADTQNTAFYAPKPDFKSLDEVEDVVGPLDPDYEWNPMPEP